MWHAVLLATLSASSSGSCCGPANCQHSATTASTTQANGSSSLFDSANFHVESRSPHCDARHLAVCCESWRKHLQAKWLGSNPDQTWNPRCTIVVHARRETYRAAIGRGGEQTFGSSLIDVQAGKIASRRIDLLCDSRGTISALGHELTHVVIADAFPNGPPPAWANEGAAVLADSTAKQQLHKRDLDQSLQSRAAFHCAELLQLADYPAPHRIPAFYGHSASLIAFLIDTGGAEKLIPFIKDAAHRGYDLALREHFGIHDVAELQRRWLHNNSL
jgi:hypothetical protein